MGAVQQSPFMILVTRPEHFEDFLLDANGGVQEEREGHRVAGPRVDRTRLVEAFNDRDGVEGVLGKPGDAHLFRLDAGRPEKSPDAVSLNINTVRA